MNLLRASILVEIDEIKQTTQLKESEIEILKKKTMNISMIEGSFASLSLICGDNYITPYALQLGSTNSQVGILRSFTGIMGPLGQIFGSKLMEKFTRKGLLIKGVFSQAAMWIPVLLLGVLYWNGIITSTLPLLLIIIYSIYSIIGGMMNPVWFSLMGDVVQENLRGRYFGKRNVVVNLVALLGTLLMTWVFSVLEGRDLVLVAFMIIFFISFIGRSFSSFSFTKHYNPPFELKKDYYINLPKFIKQIPKDNFGLFTLFIGLIYFAQMIAGPFFSVYMIQDLHYSYSLYTIVNLSSSFFSLFTFSVLGRFADKFGNVRLLKIGSIMIPLLPLLWIVFVTPLQIIFIPQLLSGIGWTAFNLAASNFIYDNVPSQRRGLFVAYNNLFIGLGTLVGGIVGSLIIAFIPINFMNMYHFLFLLSGIVRGIVVIIFFKKIKEVRVVAKLRKEKSIIDFKPQTPNSQKGFFHILVIKKKSSKKTKKEINKV